MKLTSKKKLIRRIKQQTKRGLSLDVNRTVVSNNNNVILATRKYNRYAKYQQIRSAEQHVNSFISKLRYWVL